MCNLMQKKTTTGICQISTSLSLDNSLILKTLDRFIFYFFISLKFYNCTIGK